MLALYLRFIQELLRTFRLAGALKVHLHLQGTRSTQPVYIVGARILRERPETSTGLHSTEHMHPRHHAGTSYLEELF